MDLNEFDFELPKELIAKYPLEKRDATRLLVARAGCDLEHKRFRDLPALLQPGDVLVRNNSKVMPARLYVKTETGSKVEVFLYKPLTGNKWLVMAKPARKLKPGQAVYKIAGQAGLDPSVALQDDEGAGLQDDEGAGLQDDEGVGLRDDEGVEHQVYIDKQENSITVEFASKNSMQEILRDHGQMPIPPYLQREEEAIDKERYQTVYAEHKDSGASVAAPTAGLHFTPELFAELQAKGVELIDVTLHVGLGTFAPIKTDNLLEHKMHSESYEIEEQAWRKILAAKEQGRRIVVVGTTTTRVLESVVRTGELRAETDIFIYPGFEFKIVDALITNFHLPKSTLLLLISAFAGVDRVKSLYEEAVEAKYRFYSYGDACFFC